MTYSHEVEMMCPVAQGANHGTAAGYLQADSERKRGRYPGSSR